MGGAGNGWREIIFKIGLRTREIATSELWSVYGLLLAGTD